MVPRIPAGNATNYLNTAPFVAFVYAYRLNRLFQADATIHRRFHERGSGSKLPGYQDYGPLDQYCVRIRTQLLNRATVRSGAVGSGPACLKSL